MTNDNNDSASEYNKYLHERLEQKRAIKYISDSSEPKSISDISENSDANELNVRNILECLEYLGIIHENSENTNYYSMNEFFIRWRKSNQLRESLSTDELQEKYTELKSVDENFSEHLGLDNPLQASQSIKSNANLQEWYKIRQQLKHVEWAIEE